MTSLFSDLSSPTGVMRYGEQTSMEPFLAQFFSAPNKVDWTTGAPTPRWRCGAAQFWALVKNMSKGHKDPSYEYVCDKKKEIRDN